MDIDPGFWGALICSGVLLMLILALYGLRHLGERCTKTSPRKPGRG